MNKTTASVIGIVLGIVIIVSGFFVQGISIERTSSSIGRDIRFGADFYTEMYDVTRDVGYAVNNAKNTIVDAVEGVCDAIGWLIVAIGVFDVAYFIYKMVSDDEGYSVNYYRAAPSATAPTYTTQRQATPAVSSARPVITPTAKADEWKCTCGRIHKKYESSCVCGAAKTQAVHKMTTPDVGNAAESTTPKKEKTLAENLEYALCYTTDEGMIRYLQGIDDVLVKNILKEPTHLIRGLVQKALQEMK